MFLSVKGRKIGGSSCPNGSKVSYRCGRCRKAFDDAKSIILHAQQAHRISQMPYPCPDCGVAGYNCNKLLKKHLRNKCLGRGWETRLEANGNIRIRENSPQDTYSRRTSSHLEKPASKLSSNCDLLVSGKVRRKAPKSAPIPGGRVHHKNRLRRSSLRSAQSEMLTNDRSGIPEDFPSKPFSKEETFANPPSEVSSSHESLPISVRMSTRMRTMSSSEQKRTKEAGNCNPVPHGQLGTVVPKGEGKYSPKVGRKDASSNFAVSSRNRLVSSPTESKKKSPLQKISKVDSPRNLKKSRSIAAKSVESTVCASENSGVSGKLTTGSGSSNATNPQSTGRLHASPTKSARSNTDASKKSHRSHGSSISRGSLDVSSDSKESHSSAYVPNESAAGKKKGSAKLKSAGAVVKTIKLKSDDLKRGDELATEAKYPTSERAPDDDVEMPTVVRNRCDVAQAIKPESSEAFMDKSSGFGPLREASEVDEVSRVSKRSIPVKPTSSTASDSCVKSTQCMAVSTAGKPNDGSQIAPKRSPSKFSITGLEDSPMATSTSIAAPAGTMSSTPATSSLTGKVALVDWDCFIAKDPRKARCNSATVTSAPITSNHHYTKSSQKSQPLSNVKLAVVAYRGPDTSTSQFAEQRSPSHPKEAPVAEVSTSPPSKKRVADTASSSECRSRQARSSNSSTSVSVRASIEGSNVENPTLVTPSMCNNEELSSRRVSASSLDSSLPMNDNGRVFELKISDINTLGSPSIMSSACGKESENVTQNVVRPLSSHDNSDSNSEATAPAVSNGQDLLISVSDCQVGDNQALRKRLRPRKSIDYGLARRSSKRLKVEEVENEVVSKNVNAKHKESWKDEDDEEEMGQGNSESKGKHMSTHSCPVCRLTGFATLAELKVHRTISCRRKLKKPKHLKERSIAWYCPGCPTTQGPFESAADLLTHLLTCRTKKFCGGRVKVNHPALSTGPLCPSTLLGPSTTFGCSVCGVIVASESRLDKHRRDEHNY